MEDHLPGRARGANHVVLRSDVGFVDRHDDIVSLRGFVDSRSDEFVLVGDGPLVGRLVAPRFDESRERRRV